MLRIKTPSKRNNRRTYPRRAGIFLNHSTIQYILYFFLILFSLLFISAPDDVQAGQVTLAWDSNSEPDVAGYKIYYGTVSRDYDWFIDVGNVTTITLTDLTDGLTYYFAATAYDNSNPPLESAYSTEVSKNMCSYSISQTNASFTAAGGTGSVSVSTQPGCSWTASSGASWMTITSGASGIGNGTVNYSISSNTGGQRIVSSTIAGKVLTVTQSGVTTYTITSSAGSGGTISPSGSVSVIQGGNQTFTISAGTGYQIANVTVDGVSQGVISSYTFSNVTGNHTISASFSVKTYTVTASAGTGGSISPSGPVSVNHGESQTFTISPNTGYTISNVTVDGVSQGTISTYTFSNVTANHTINATFLAITYPITASAGTGGNISPSGSVSVNHGANQTFSISASTGYTIADVLVDGSSVGAVSSYTFSNVTSSHSISARFSIMTYSISSSSGAGGSISPNGSVTVNHGANQSFTISPDAGYGVSNVLVDGTSVGAVSSYIFSNVTANHTISASFALNTYTINASAGAGGVISPSGAIPVSGGSNQTFTISANTGYKIADVLVDGSSVGAVSSFTFSNINSSHTITASFSADSYTIVASAGVGGTISPSGSVTVNHGSNQAFTIAANSGYQITDVSVDGVSQGAISSYTFSNVAANHTISAVFSLGTYTISTSAGTGGFISPAGPVSVNHGESQTFTITANTGYKIANVRTDWVSRGAISSYTFNNVKANHTISATFTLDTYTITASAGSGGTISPSGMVSVSYGTSRTFTVTPSLGYTISDVIVDGVSQGATNTYTFSNVAANHTIQAYFSKITYTIQASASTGGMISPSGSVAVAQGTNYTFTITANDGYSIADVLVDGSSVGPVSTYTFTSVTSSHVISASFLQGYTLIVTKSGNGSGTVTSTPTARVYAPGTKVTLKAIKDMSSAFAGFTGDCTTTRASCTVVMNKHNTVDAAFTLRSFKVKAAVVGNGSVSIEGPVSVKANTVVETETMTKKAKKVRYETTTNYGDQLIYIITPEPGNYIKEVLVDGKSVGVAEAITLADIKHNHKMKVKFAAEELPSSSKHRVVMDKVFLQDSDEPENMQTVTGQSVDEDNATIERSPTRYASKNK